MRGHPGKKASVAAKARHAARKASGLIKVSEAAKLANRAVRTINLWYDSEEIRGEVLDHRRYVNRADVIATAKRKNERFG